VRVVRVMCKNPKHIGYSFTKVLNRAFVGVLLTLVLMLSSCKKQVSQGKIKNKAQVKYKVCDSDKDSAQKKRERSRNKSNGEEKDIFSPISVLQAKQFVNNLTNFTGIDGNTRDKIDTFSKDISIKDFSESVRQIEAKLYDIPVPIDSESLKGYFGCTSTKNSSQNSIILGYVNTLSDTDIIAFYNQEMERLGWKQICFFDGINDGIEKLLLFKKPSRFCSVLIGRYNGDCSDYGDNRGRGSCTLPITRNSKVQEQAKIVIFTQL